MKNLWFFLFLIFGTVFGASENVIHVCFVSDEKFMTPTTVALASVLKNSDRDDEFHFYIIDMGISKISKAKILALKRIKNFKIDFLNISDGRIKLIPVDGRKKSQRVGVATYARIFLCDLFPHLNKILYLDGDILVRGSLKELWRTEIKNHYLAAVPDYICYLKMRDYVNFILSYKNQKSSCYFNAGVLLMNLKKFRNDKIPEKILKRIFELFRQGKLIAYDQDALNNLLGFATKFVNLKFNYLADYNDIDEVYSKAARIVHFAGDGPKIWDSFNVVINEAFACEYFEVQELAGYLTFKDLLRKYWILYIFNPFIRASVSINRFCESLFG